MICSLVADTAKVTGIVELLPLATGTIWVTVAKPG
jgi:hypothetical protein